MITCSVAGIIQVGSKVLCFVRLSPLRRRAVVIVRVGIVIMHIHSRQHRTSRWAAHRRCNEGIGKCGTAVSQVLHCLWHEIQRSLNGKDKKQEIKTKELSSDFVFRCPLFSKSYKLPPIKT